MARNLCTEYGVRARALISIHTCQVPTRRTGACFSDLDDPDFRKRLEEGLPMKHPGFVAGRNAKARLPGCLANRIESMDDGLQREEAPGCSSGSVRRIDRKGPKLSARLTLTGSVWSEGIWAYTARHSIRHCGVRNE